MKAILEFINLEDFVPLALLVIVLCVVGSQMAAVSSTAQRLAKILAACGFVTFAIVGIAEWQAETPWEFLQVVIRSLIAGGLVLGLSLVLLPMLVVVYRNTLGLVLANGEMKPEQPQQRKERDVPVEKSDPPPPIPPPTAAERASTAQQRYEERLRVLATAKLDDTELKAAQDRAKQLYLKDLNEVMK